MTEDFKLSSGTWVHVGALRARAVEALSPVAEDVVIAGHDRADTRLLVFPNIAACRGLCPDRPNASPSELISDVRVCARVREGLRSLETESDATSLSPSRALLLEEPPSIDGGEITDKGYINQMVVLERRASLVENLFSETARENVIHPISTVNI